MTQSAETLLGGLRVLDLSDHRGLLCGQILADLGADVIQIEPPRGSPARGIGPFYQGKAHPERSLTWWAYTRNKRSVVVDLETAAGQATFRLLVQSADFVIESFRGDELGRLGLGYDELARLNPRLIYVAITAFGRSGPKAAYADTDLIVLAAGGPLALTGDADRAPLRISVPQAYMHAASDAAAAALIAHHERARSGLGQAIEVSAQQSVALATQSTILSTGVGFVASQRMSGGTRLGPLSSQLVYPAKDGYVSITLLFGSAFGRATRRLFEYIYEHGGCDAATRDKDWIFYFEHMMTGEESFDEYDRVKRVVAEFTTRHTKADLLAAGLERGLLIAPVTTTAEVVDSPQLAARNFFAPVEHGDLGTSIRYPGAFARFSETPIITQRRPPHIGEHTREVLAESDRTMPAAAAPAHIEVIDPRPLAGVKILDFMWAIAGPAATRILADYGATIVRVETASHPDACRTLPPFLNAQIGPDTSVLFHNMNAGKLMLSLDLSKPEARPVVLDLVRWADVVCESFSPKAMRHWGFTYDQLRDVNPEIVMLSTCLMGQTGPLSQFAGFGNLAGAITGFYELCGWPDRAPAGPFGAYTDYIAPRFNAAAVLAALEYRRRTGKGQHIDLSQAEAAASFLAPALLDYTANGRVWSRVGNADASLAPHGVYPSHGDDCWVAIAVETRRQWRGLCDVIGRSSWGDEPRLATAADRRVCLDEIDAAITAWTTTVDMRAAETELQARQVPAHAVQTSTELCDDPQLRHQQHFVTLHHPEQGPMLLEGSRFRLSRTPAQVGGSAATFGRDNQKVLADLLGYDENRITELVIAEVLQ